MSILSHIGIRNVYVYNIIATLAGCCMNNSLNSFSQDRVPLQPKPVKTSFEFKTKTLDDNQFYIGICLLITMIVCVNPFGFMCAVPGLYYAHKVSADITLYPQRSLAWV